MTLRLVLDTNVLVTALCNRGGASHLLIRWALTDKVVLLASPALWLEYEAVLKRPEIRLRHGISLENLDVALVTFNTKDFADAADRFALKLATPAEYIKLTGDIS